MAKGADEKQVSLKWDEYAKEILKQKDIKEKQELANLKQEFLSNQHNHIRQKFQEGAEKGEWSVVFRRNQISNMEIQMLRDFGFKVYVAGEEGWDNVEVYIRKLPKWAVWCIRLVLTGLVVLVGRLCLRWIFGV